MFATRTALDRATGCLVWTGPLNSGNPQMGWIEGRDTKVRRPARAWAWEQHHGPTPAGHRIIATCGDRRCVSPDHAVAVPFDALPHNSAERKAARFWARVDRSGDACWPWLGFVDPNTGYGRTIWQGMTVGAHQLAFLLANGWRPRGRAQYICHHCDNPICCRPDHLYAGTPAQNSADRDRRGRARTRRGTSQPNAGLTADQVREIRRRYAAGGTSYPKLAAEFGIHPQNIGRVVRREGYSDVD